MTVIFLSTRNIRLDSARKHIKESAKFCKKIFALIKSRLTCTRVLQKKITEEGKSSWSRVYHIICQTQWRQHYGVGMCVASKMRPLEFIDDVSAERSSRINWEMNRSLCSHSAKCCNTDRTALHSTNGYCRRTSRLFQNKEMRYSLMAKST